MKSVTLIALILLAFSTNVFAGSGSFSASESHALMRNSDGSVCAVGQNGSGELGDGTFVNQSIPEKLSDLAGVSYLSTGWYHSLAVKTDGTVWTWGDNSQGELGDSTTVNRPTPDQVPGFVGTIAVAAGQNYSLALKSDGTVWAWGYNYNGQLGDGTTIERLSPVPTMLISSVTAVNAGDYHSLALKSDGTVWAWGDNFSGQLGDGTFTQRTSPVQVAGLSGVIAISAGAGYSLALKSDGTVWAWGDNTYGELGDGSNITRPNIVQAGTLTGVAAISAGDEHSLALRSDGTVWAWGNNINGELGDNTTISRNVPVQSIGLTGGVAVAAGVAHSTALKSDGSVWAWGDNTYGQLGTGNTVPALSPTTSLTCASIPPASGRSYSEDRLKASERHSISVRNDGTVWAWGQNASGELGDGTTIDHSSPVQASSLTGVTKIAAGWFHTLATRSDGTVWAWGDNYYGELGDSTAVPKLTPNQVPTFTGAIAVAAGYGHSLALKSNGAVWSWGNNYSGQLGDGTTSGRLSPVQTLVISGATAVAAGDAHSLALKSDGTVWGWGSNSNGQLGDGSPCYYCYYGYSAEIVRASGLTDIVAISAGDGHSLAVKSDGTVWAWGYNGDGELGDASKTSENQPVQAIGLSDMVAVAAGSQHSLALKSDGTIWAWGDNTYGQFGETYPAVSVVPVSAVPAGIGGVATLTLIMAEAGAGMVIASPPSPDGTYPTGTTVCLTATPNFSWVFSSFTGDPLDSSHCLFMDANHSVTANFSPVALRFVPVTPCRIADTRGNGFTGAFGPPSLPAGIARDFPIGGSCGIPAANAYSMNIAVVPTGRGYLTVWRSQDSQPLVTTLNTDGRVKSNAAIIPAGSNGAISVYTSVNTDVVLDINGYFVPATDQPTALAFYPLTPCRVADTRNAVGPLGGPFISGNSSRTFPVRSATTCNISSTAQAYSLNLAVVPRAGKLSYLTAWPTGQPQPLVASLNDPLGIVLSNAAIVSADASGQIDIFAKQDTDVVIDINGYFAPPGTGGLSLYNLAPCRALDSRNPPGSLPFTGTLAVDIIDSVCGAPSTAQAYVFNGTVVPQASHGFLTLWQHGQTQPLAANLNASDGTITGNMAIVPTSDGSINAYFSGTTFLILDLFGYFAP